MFLKIYYIIQLYHFLVYIHRDLRVSQRYLLIHVYCDTIHNNQDMKPIYISINKWTEWDNMVVLCQNPLSVVCVHTKTVKKVAWIITRKCFAIWACLQVHVWRDHSCFQQESTQWDTRCVTRPQQHCMGITRAQQLYMSATHPQWYYMCVTLRQQHGMCHTSTATLHVCHTSTVILRVCHTSAARQQVYHTSTQTQKGPVSHMSHSNNKVSLCVPGHSGEKNEG